MASNMTEAQARAMINGGRTAEVPVVAAPAEPVDLTAVSKAKRAARKEAAKVERSVAAEAKTNGRRQSRKERLTGAPAPATPATPAPAATDGPTAAPVALGSPEMPVLAYLAPLAAASRRRRALETAAPVAVRKCPGAPTYGLPAHEAPPSAWHRPENRLCRTCARDLQRVRNARARAAAQGGQGATEAPEAAPAATGRRRKAAETALEPVVVVDATEQQAAEHAALEAQVAAAGGVATEAGQEVLAQAAADAAAQRRALDAERKRRQRAIAKAAAEQAQQ